MTLRELKVIIDRTLMGKNQYYDPEVKVIIDIRGVGSTPSVPVKTAHRGIDWDSYQFMIIPEDNLVKQVMEK